MLAKAWVHRRSAVCHLVENGASKGTNKGHRKLNHLWVAHLSMTHRFDPQWDLYLDMQLREHQALLNATIARWIPHDTALQP